MVLNATLNNISITSQRSDLLVEETGVPGENHQPTASLNKFDMENRKVVFCLKNPIKF